MPRSTLAVLFLVVSLSWSGCGGDSETPSKDIVDDVIGGDAVVLPGDGQDGDTATKDTAAGDGGADVASEKDPALAKMISDLTYDTPTPWASPLTDYFTAADKAAGGQPYDHGIHDLMPFDGKLFIGFGAKDAAFGAAAPVAMRALSSSISTATVDEFTSAEEAIDRYRRLGDELWTPGLDATEDGWLGNVYRRVSGGGWTKHRSVTHGLHVHDVARHAGALWAVGSGATKKQSQDGDVYAHLWRSTDDGATMTVVAKAWNNSEGDARWAHLLPTEKGLMVFGFRRNAQNKLAELSHGFVNEVAGGPTTILPLGPTHKLKAVLVVDCWPIGKGRGIVTGVNILKTPQRLTSWLVDGADATPLSLEGNAIVDVHVEGEEVALLGVAGDAYPLKKTGATWTTRVWLSSDQKVWTKILDFSSPDQVTALAWWRGHLFLGSTLGELTRADGHWPKK